MIISIIGNKGDGKTLFMTKCLVDYKTQENYIYSNYKLSKIKHNILNVNMLQDFQNNNKNLENTLIGIDEAHIFLDSRNFMSKKNKTIGYFLLQSRKRKIKCFLTFQKINQIDIRLRQNTSFFVFCNSYEIVGQKLVKLIEGEPLFDEKNVIIIYDIWKTDKINNFEFVGKNCFYAKDYYNYYDTNEIINFLGD